MGVFLLSSKGFLRMFAVFGVTILRMITRLLLLNPVESSFLGVEVSISTLSSCDGVVIGVLLIHRLRRLVLYRLFRQGKRATS